MAVRNENSLQGLVEHFRTIRDAVERGRLLGTVDTVLEAHKYAVSMCRDEFTGRMGYVKTGALQNSIFPGFDKKTGVGFVGVRAHKDGPTPGTKPYGRIHEYGGVIRPVNAKHLWQKLWGAGNEYKRWTPRDFMNAMKTDKKSFAIFRNPKTNKLIAANISGKRVVPLFLLRDETVIPARPYIRPAVGAVFPDKMMSNIQRRIAEQMKGG